MLALNCCIERTYLDFLRIKGLKVTSKLVRSRSEAAQHVFDKVWKTACYILVAEFFVEIVISPDAYDHKLTSNQKLNFYSNPLGPQTTLNLLTYNVLDPVHLLSLVA